MLQAKVTVHVSLYIHYKRSLICDQRELRDRMVVGFTTTNAISTDHH